MGKHTMLSFYTVLCVVFLLLSVGLKAISEPLLLVPILRIASMAVSISSITLVSRSWIASLLRVGRRRPISAAARGSAGEMGNVSRCHRIASARFPGSEI